LNTRAPSVIHQFGRPVKAKLLDGRIVERQDEIYVPSHHAIYPCLDYDQHFVYYDGNALGSTLRCTCGGTAAAFGYQAYKKYCSYMGEKVIGCVTHLQTGRHDDESS